ncbi:unnamed protein product [Microthlaspi erraticum]|uniref:F-box domain-containing protein n=1 Tax=Microthlaspi erraticum TaxID=1685480 RepID=A0A6D2K4B7_9BRAS|nr:unnamed protein product [Microthlaspi erraticum]
MMNKRNTEYLPDDLVVEILSRAPTKSLARFRSTSKGWNALVKEERFSKKHSANASRQSLVIMLIDFRVYVVSVDLRAMQDNKVALTRQFTLEDPQSNSSEEVDICNVIHCDGLLLCTTEDDRLVVWNPVSGETKWIQPRKSFHKNDVFALGYDRKSSCYKIMRMDHFDDRFATAENELEIYDFTSNSRSVLSVTAFAFSIRRSQTRGVYVKGSTYWLAHDEALHKFLQSFDFSTETFQSRSSLPYPPDQYYSSCTLSVVREDQICLLDVYSLDVWMSSKIESNGFITWSKIRKAIANYKFSYGMSFVADEQHKVLVCYDKKNLHIVAEDRYIQVTDNGHGENSSCAFVQSYVPTLVRIQQGL